ncbi:MAG: hypothetical protein VX738_10930 [Planctomycetota bacterium]|nr:hypothetical protein [Planctomycetota bacterium]
MEDTRSYTIFGFVIAYMVMCIVVGLWAMRRTRNTKDFFMAGRHLGMVVTSVAVFSSTMSGFGFVGGPGLVYQAGTSSFWMVINMSIGMCIMFFLLGKRLRLFAELREPVSLPAAVTARYNSRFTGGLTAIAIILGVVTYLGVQIKAMAVVLFQILQDLPWAAMELQWCYAISCAVLVFYCVTGGIIASVYTDLIQGLIMVVAAVLVLLTTMATVDGGLTGMAETITQDDPEAMQPWGTFGMISCLSFYFIMAIGVCGQPHVITKLMMTEKVSDTRRMLPVSVAGYGLAALLWISIGLCMRAVVLNGIHENPLTSADDAASEFLTHYANPMLAGIVFAGLFAAIMSTADSFLNIGAAALVHDLPKSLSGRTLGHELIWARLAIVLIAVGAGLLAYHAGEMVAILGVMGWSIFAIAIVPVVAIGFNWKRANRLAANVSVITGLVCYGGLYLREIRLPYNFHQGAFSMLVTLTVFFLVALVTPANRLDKDIDAVMDL